MHRLSSLLSAKNSLSNVFSYGYGQKVLSALVKHVYSQTIVAMIASLFCASIIVISLYDSEKNNIEVFSWAAFFLLITVSRMILVGVYYLQQSFETRVKLWSNLYIIGSALGGLSWGVISIFLFPDASPMQQTLIVLMLAGVTAAAVPLSAAIPGASVVFLVFSLFPFIISIALLKNYTYLLFDIALCLYLIYTILLSIKAHQLIKGFILLKFEKDALLDNLEISNKKLAQAATHDPLTQMANRSLFDEIFERALKKAIENNSTLALFYIDLDNFKSANDEYGHAVGDYILLEMTKRLMVFFRKEDCIARLGGDEFAVIIENITRLDQITSVAQKICQLISIPISVPNLNEMNIQISASIGICIYPQDGADKSELLRCADKCMYNAKKKGGNQFHMSKKLETWT